MGWSKRAQLKLFLEIFSGKEIERKINVVMNGKSEEYRNYSFFIHSDLLKRDLEESSS